MLACSPTWVVLREKWGIYNILPMYKCSNSHWARTKQKISFTPGFCDTFFVKPKGNIELFFVLLFNLGSILIICLHTYFTGNLINGFSDTMASIECFHDNMTAILASKHNETVVMLVTQTNPMGVELFSYKMFSFALVNAHGWWSRVKLFYSTCRTLMWL